MTTLKLASRKNTTENARKSVIDFINSFDFSQYEDLPYIESKNFNLLFDRNGNQYFQDKAYFSLRICGFCIVSYSRDDENNGIRRVDFEREWTKVEEVFDNTCIYINFKQLVSAMEDFIAKINEAVQNKENEIVDFMEYVEGWKSYQDTAKNADEVSEITETL